MEYRFATSSRRSHSGPSSIGGRLRIILSRVATTRSRRFGLSNLLKKKSRRSDRDFEVFVSVSRKKRRQDSELKLQAGVFGYRRGGCLDLLHPCHTVSGRRSFRASRLIVICEKLV